MNKIPSQFKLHIQILPLQKSILLFFVINYISEFCMAINIDSFFFFAHFCFKAWRKRKDDFEVKFKIILAFIFAFVATFTSFVTWLQNISWCSLIISSRVFTVQIYIGGQNKLHLAKGKWRNTLVSLLDIWAMLWLNIELLVESS